MMNARERVLLAYLGFFLLMGLGWMVCRRSRERNRQTGFVSSTQAEGWNQQLSTAREVDVNTATSAELERLPGIGPALASRIVEDRNQHGPFSSVHDITRVSGIGEKMFESIRRRLTVKQSE